MSNAKVLIRTYEPYCTRILDTNEWICDHKWSRQAFALVVNGQNACGHTIALLQAITKIRSVRYSL